MECGRALAALTRHPVCILRGGYEHFSATYHFLRTQKIIWMPQVRRGAEPRPAWMDALSPPPPPRGPRDGEPGRGRRGGRRGWKGWRTLVGK